MIVYFIVKETILSTFIQKAIWVFNIFKVDQIREFFFWSFVEP